MDWLELLAAGINCVGALAATQLLKRFVPWLHKNYPQTLPLFAAFVGLGVQFISEQLTSLLGYPVDLSAIMAVFSGASAVAVHQFWNQRRKGEF